MNRAWLVAAIAAAGILWLRTDHVIRTSEPPRPSSAALAQGSALEHAIAAHSEGVRVQGSGTVVKILADDRQGSPHQRFIVRLPSGHTVLIAHNLDVASRVAPLAEGDGIEFGGEFAWNPRGGVVHWTHHDPAGRHVAGWIRHQGRTVQ